MSFNTLARVATRSFATADVNNVAIAEAQAVLPDPKTETCIGAGAQHDNAVLAARALVAITGGRINVVSSHWPRESVADAIADTISNIKHLCDAVGLDFDALSERGTGHYREEISTTR